MKRTVLLSPAVLLLSGCWGPPLDATPPPAGWDEACAETGARHHETPPADGLAVEETFQPERILLRTQAAWVEHNFYGSGIFERPPETYDWVDRARADVYREGVGRYAIRLARLDTEACQSSLRDYGFDPATLAWVGLPEPHSDHNPVGLLSCIEAKRTGDVVAMRRSGGPPPQEWLKTWSAPYIALLAVSRDPRSGPEHPTQRRAHQIVRRETGAVVAEQISLWHVRSKGADMCGGPDDPHGMQYPAAVFAKSDARRN
jgi:hypothetical protein